MSNDKVAATFSGAESKNVACCWLARHTAGADHVRMCVNHRETTGEHIQEKLADPQYGMISTADAAESAKVFMQHIADTYGEPEHLKQARDARFRAEYSNQYLRDMAPEKCECLRAPGDPDRARAHLAGPHHADVCPLYIPERGFFPLTAGEIQMGVVIVIAIIICFILYAAVFRW